MIGVPTWRKYLQTWQSDRRVIQRYGSDIASQGKCTRLYWKIWGKSVIWTLAVALRQQQRLLQRRSVAISAEERAAAMEELARLLRVPCPASFRIAETAW